MKQSENESFHIILFLQASEGYLPIYDMFNAESFGLQKNLMGMLSWLSLGMGLLILLRD